MTDKIKSLLSIQAGAPVYEKGRCRKQWPSSIENGENIKAL